MCYQSSILFLGSIVFVFISFLIVHIWGRQLTAFSAVKMCFVVFLFPQCCLPLFHFEAVFPFSAWKQAAGQQQVSLSRVVRSSGQPPFCSAEPRVNQAILSRFCFVVCCSTNHGEVLCFMNFISVIVYMHVIFFPLKCVEYQSINQVQSAQ